MVEKRQINRAPIRTDVEVTSDALGLVKAHTLELSDVGAFIESQTLQQLTNGTVVSIQAIGFPEPMPIIQAEIIRVTRNGVGVRFLL
ncbi:PilZ domain-containing protein [Pleionea sediminis]|uniref:PilZ domain-containing protein n=1 Tax=Pleionea sediminis TaxID=2569479 RepID=UPI001186EC67|nr:PilZ domain-containing protein [Pleionea sediminis]